MTPRLSPSSPELDPVERRTPAGSNYGDVVPASSRKDPSRGAELERDAMPATADFGKPPPDSAAAREQTNDLDAPTPDGRTPRAAHQRQPHSESGNVNAESDLHE